MPFAVVVGKEKGEEVLAAYPPIVEAFPFGCLMPDSKKDEKGKDAALKRAFKQI